MEEQATWKGHSFTLLVFAGIVFLCSIFFVLGMLVGRQQGQKFASVAAAEAASKAAAPAPAAAVKPELTFYAGVEDTAPPAAALDPEPAKPEPVVEAPRAPAAPVPTGPVVNFQIAAVRKSNDAEKLFNEAKKKGFKAFILVPGKDDVNPFYRIQVGPYSDTGEAELDRRKLVAAGYQPIKK